MSLFELSVGFVLSLSWKTAEFFQEREFLIKHSICSRTWLIGFFEKIASEGGLRNQRLRPARTLRTFGVGSPPDDDCPEPVLATLICFVCMGGRGLGFC
jgi:hypothetical protein